MLLDQAVDNGKVHGNKLIAPAPSLWVSVEIPVCSSSWKQPVLLEANMMTAVFPLDVVETQLHNLSPEP